MKIELDKIVRLLAELAVDEWQKDICKEQTGSGFKTKGTALTTQETQNVQDK